jgi:hypothetical protein
MKSLLLAATAILVGDLLAIAACSFPRETSFFFALTPVFTSLGFHVQTASLLMWLFVTSLVALGTYDILKGLFSLRPLFNEERLTQGSQHRDIQLHRTRLMRIPILIVSIFAGVLITFAVLNSSPYILYYAYHILLIPVSFNNAITVFIYMFLRNRFLALKSR